MSTSERYMPTVSPWTLSSSQLAQLRERVADAERAVNALGAGGPEDERIQRTQHARALRRELQAAEHERTRERQREHRLAVQAEHARAASAVPTQQFAEPVPYFASPDGSFAANAAGADGPDWWAQTRAAIAVLRQRCA